MEDLIKNCLDGERGARIYHLVCDLVGVERAKVFVECIQNATLTGNPTVLFAFPSANDLWAAKMSVRDAPEAEIQEQAMFFITYAEWMQTAGWTKMARGRYVFILDMGLGYLTGDMELMMATLVQWLRKTQAESDEKDWSLTIWTLSSSQRPLIDNSALSSALGANLPTVGTVIIKPPTLPEAPTRHKAGRTWGNDARDTIVELDKASKDAATFVIVSGYKDARRISTAAKLEFHSLGPWSTTQAIEAAVQASTQSKIIHVDRDTGSLPEIDDLAGVFVAPSLVDFTFDTATASVVEANIKMPYQEELARMIAGSEDVPVHLFELDDDDPAHQLVAIDEGRGYVTCGLHHVFPGVRQNTLPFTSRNRLQVFAGIAHLTMAGLLNEESTVLKFTDFSLFLGQETNLSALILLESVIRQPAMSLEAKMVRVELAMLLSQGLSSILDTELHHIPNKLRDYVRGLAEAKWMAAQEAFRGQLWISLAMIHAYRVGWALEWQKDLFAAVRQFVRPAVVEHILGRVEDWLERLGIRKLGPKTRRSKRLTADEMLDLETVLVVALAYNIIATPTPQDARLAMVHTTADVDFEEADRTVDWAAFREQHPADFTGADKTLSRSHRVPDKLPGVQRCVYSVCPTLGMTISQQTGDKKYHPLWMTGVTGASIERADLDDRFQVRHWINRYSGNDKPPGVTETEGGGKEWWLGEATKEVWLEGSEPTPRVTVRYGMDEIW